MTDALRFLQGQINALVLAPDSTTVNQELSQSRTAMDGTVCSTLQERLERDLTLLQQIATAQNAGLMDAQDKARMDNPEIGLSPVTRIGELAIDKGLTHSNAIVQSHYYNSDSNVAYTCQGRTLDGKQQLVFQKHSMNGAYSGEWMVIDWASHGSVFFVTTEHGIDYLWVGIDRATGSDPILSKIQWSQNAEVSYPSALITTYDHFNLDHMPYAMVDKDRDIIAFRFVGTINYFIGLDGKAQYTGDEIVVRKLSDVIAGRDQVLARWAMPDDSKYYPCQGFDIHGGAFYWQSGAKNADEQAVSKFDLMTGKVQLRMSLKGLFAQSQAGAGDTASIEPEGLQVVPDHGRGNAMITIGNQVGAWGERRHVVNALNAEGCLDLVSSWQNNQYDLPHFPDGYGVFSAFWQPGSWYVTQAQMRKLIDGPEHDMSKWVGAAILVNYITPYGYRRQEIKSLRQSHYANDWHRHSGQFGSWTATQIMGSTCNGWVRHKKQPVILWKGDLSHAGDRAYFNAPGFQMHLAYARRITIYYKNPASSGSAVRTATFEVTKHADGSLDMANVPIYGLNIPDNLGTQGQNYLKAFEMSMHFYTDHLYIRHNNTISMAPDWNAAVVHKNDAGASMIHILRVEGEF